MLQLMQTVVNSMKCIAAAARVLALHLMEVTRDGEKALWCSGEMIIEYLLCVDIDTLVGSVLLVPTVTLSLVVAWSCH